MQYSGSLQQDSDDDCRGLEGWDSPDDDDEQDDVKVPSEETQAESSAWGAFEKFSIANGAADMLRRIRTETLSSKMNILLLGETGVGKSTMINAFANYITFRDMENAMSSDRDLIALLPMCFTHTDLATFESHEIKFGEEDQNEQHKGGEAVTQECRTYTFPVSEDLEVNIIDTPGLGDTRGVEQDQINFTKMLAYIANYDVIHGICILLKPNISRLNITFRFCIKELLCHLHKSASTNIVFLFTHTRGSCYSPGDTVIPLKSLLAQIPDVVIPFNASTVYCVDNEAFRLVLASKKGFSFTDGDKRTFSESWSRSSEACQKMLEHFNSINPHKVMETVSLNHAATLAKSMQQPMADVGSVILENMESCKAEMEALANCKGDATATIDVYELELKAERLEKGAATVCMSPECTQKIMSKETGNEEMTFTICHQPCILAIEAKVGEKASWFCSNISFFGKCKSCGCSTSTHQRRAYVPHFVSTRKEPDAAVKEQLDAGDNVKARKVQMENCQKRLREWEKESKEIMHAAACFASFFKKNAMSTCNDSMKEYVDHQIYVEMAKPDYRLAMVMQLKEWLRNYEASVEERDRLARLGKGDISAEEVMRIAKGLYNLRHTGAKLRELVEEVTQVERQTARLRAKACPKPPGTAFFTALQRNWFRP